MVGSAGFRRTDVTLGNTFVSGCAEAQRSCDFDRGVPDVVGYLRWSGLPIPLHVERAAQMFRYHRRVFVAPPWPEFFAPDTERKQSFEAAEATYETMIETYSAFGYELIPLPLNSVEERVRLVLAVIG